jgi:hypothetical protein
VKDKIYPLHSFDSHEDAEKWAQLQISYLDKDYFYSIAMWSTTFSDITPCKDNRLRLVK